MTHIEFYTGVNDPVSAVHRLALKVYASGRKLRIATPDAETTERLDRMLWEMPEDAFVPHCTLASPLRAETPIVIDHSLEHDGDADVLINICKATPRFFSRFERFIEIVSKEHAIAGRDRWLFYKARGYPMQHTDLSQRER